MDVCCPPCGPAGEKALAQFGHPFRSLVLRIRLVVLLKRDCLGLLLAQVRFDLITMGQVVFDGQMNICGAHRWNYM